MGALAVGAAVQAGTVKELDLAQGSSGDTTIREPVFAAPAGFSSGVGCIEGGYDRQGRILRQLSKGMFTRDVKADVDPCIGLVATLAQAMRAEAVTMGLPAGGQNPPCR
ncbi:MAG: hypothetical protein HXY19_05825 [Thermoanaerobaculaceae bacterium]|nr:hypothetical protein [Thermoanaerobaculaceae bacterium]